MNDLTAIAARIIRKADAENPADAVLRTELRQAGVSRAEASQVADTVFAYYRWLGVVEERLPLERQIRETMDLEMQFQSDPEAVDISLLRKAFPGWIFDEVAVSAPLLVALQRRPALWLRARKGQGGALAGKLGECEPSAAVPDALRYDGDEDLFRTAAFQGGDFEIQDISSQVVGRICDPGAGETWWDACAGEGGKTLHLSDLMENRGLIWATDRAEWRLRKLKQRAARARIFNYRAARWDGGAKLPTKTKFDGVLIDAPCSGVGTWARNPHARWTTTIDDVRELAEVQRRLVLNAALSVKAGGKLIYAVCTLTRTETDAVADACSQTLTEFEPMPLSALPNERREASARRWIWPADFRGNGMFVAAWRRLP